MHLDWKYIIITIIIFILLLLSYLYQSSILIYIKTVFSVKILPIIITIFSISTWFISKIKVGNIKIKVKDFSFFKDNVENIVSFFSTPMTMLGGFELTKGVFLQYFYNEMYFPLYNSTMLYFLFFVSLYLLYNAIMDTIEQIKIIINPQAQEPTVEDNKSLITKH